MKRYEKMSQKEIIDFILDTENDTCSECVFKPTCNPSINYCVSSVLNYLQEEIGFDSTPRVLTIKSVNDLDILHKQFISMCDGTSCLSCKYYPDHGDDIFLDSNSGCFTKFLKEKVVREEKEMGEGGHVYSEPGRYDHVASISFVSMYPNGPLIKHEENEK